jgi:hypothetical protein
MSVKAKAQAMSGGGLLVVGTLCLVFIMAGATMCVLASRGVEIPTQLETLVGALSVGVPALLAKTYRDAPPEPDEVPTPVTVINNGEPVITEEVQPAVADGGADPVVEDDVSRLGLAAPRRRR